MTTRPRHHHRTTQGASLARGMVALLALASFGLGPLLTSLHLSLVRHTLCAEHGELVEIEQPSDTESAPVSAAALISRDVSVNDPHAHHHCDAAPVRVLPTLRPQVARDPSQPIAGRTLPSARGWTAPIQRIALLRLAPKASPPV